MIFATKNTVQQYSRNDEQPSYWRLGWSVDQVRSQLHKSVDRRAAVGVSHAAQVSRSWH